ncbi:MAG TPA: HEAT repeat domain-containing protein [Ignavibacteriaceae bacterium]|nr:HEAT repeat domain-containing protein [Ignavibacteriaceae bacterium]
MSGTVEQLINDLASSNGIIRQKARYELVKMGNPALDYLLELQSSDKHLARWESVKAISEIGSSESIPILINALDDEEFDVRWLAAEGLIDIGHSSVYPLLKAFISNKDSIHLKEGVHHVLKGLEIRGMYNDKYEIIKALETFTAPIKVELKVISMLKDELINIR